MFFYDGEQCEIIDDMIDWNDVDLTIPSPAQTNVTIDYCDGSGPMQVAVTDVDIDVQGGDYRGIGHYLVDKGHIDPLPPELTFEAETDF